LRRPAAVITTGATRSLLGELIDLISGIATDEPGDKPGHFDLVG
jgi:hypothetical protein